MDYRLEQLRFEVREDPSSRIFFKLGELLRREGEFDEAIEVLGTGVKQHPRYVAAWVSLGRAQLDNGDAEGARESFESALELDPENAVAARAMGEAAITSGDWVTAVKALKRARGLSPQDDALDERIEYVEAQLAELGLLSQPAPDVPADAAVSVETAATVEVREDEPFEVRLAGENGEADDSDDVFAAGQVSEESSPAAASEVGGEEDAAVEVADVPDRDTVAFTIPPPLTDDDVSSIVGAEAASEETEPAAVVDHEELRETDPPDAAFVAPEPEPEPVVVPEAEPEPEFDRTPEPESAVEGESGPVADVAPEPPPESWPDPEADGEPELEKDADGVPLPTMTLAQLAIDQGDLDLAERTLRGVLDREPGHAEAAELLETVVAGPPQADPVAVPSDPSDAKAKALQRWLDAVRLASERLKT